MPNNPGNILLQMQTEEYVGSNDRGQVEINPEILKRHTLKKDVDLSI